MAAMTRLRPLGLADIDAVLRLQARCYEPSLIEDGRAFEAKLRATAGLPCNWLAEQDGEPLAYVVSLPVCDDSFPAWNAHTCPSSRRARLLYLHDLAVAPAGRGRGLGQRLLARVLQAARELRLPELGLVAVQDSLAFWQRQGFAVPAALPAQIGAKLASFGADARYLSRPGE
jgi:GNAT superfamily N-acetyltransferase